MKPIFFGLVALVSSIATGAYGAPAAVYNWNGFYAGLNVGYSWGSSSTTQSFSDSTSGALLSATSGRFDMDGVIGGGQAGYNWQRMNWVFGFEADIQASAQSGSGRGICAGGTLAARPFNGACTPGHVGDTTPFDTPGLPVNFDLSQKLEWFGTVRGRLGSLFTPTILGYVTGGLAYGEVSSTGSVSGTNITGQQGTNTVILTPVSALFGDRSTRAGWTIGAGLEGVVNGNWTAKIEYLYIDLGNISGSFVTPITAPSGAPVTVRYTSHITDNILRVGFNYRFGGP
ncbi:MAG TPA: outer membrane beta-barrel protein [Bradyrhizobium sp.]|nr:outer membrane beta-barrel protein [Bradyrhizobium sp.]